MAYSDKVLDHFDNPRNMGSLDKSDPNVGTGMVGAPACLHPDTLVAVADGRGYISIKQLADEGRDVPVYSYDSSEGVVIALGRYPRLTRQGVETVRVHLDDGSSFACTPDHKIRTRNRKSNLWIPAGELSEGQSLMPFTRVVRRGYHTIHRNTLAAGRTPEHRMIYKFFNGDVPADEQIHHKNHRKLDNRPENLEALNGAEHMRHHNIERMKGGWVPPGRDIAGDKNPMREWWGGRATDEEKGLYRVHMSLSTSGELNGMFGRNHTEQSIKLIGLNRREHDYDKVFKGVCGLFESGKTMKKDIAKELGVSGFVISRAIKSESCYDGFLEFSANHNHKVARVESLGMSDVYCMTVDGLENFAIVTRVNKSHNTGIIVHNCGDLMKLQLRINDNGIIEDAKFKTFGCGSAVASSSLVTTMVIGRTTDEAEAISNSHIAKELSLPPVKIHCSVLAEDAIKAAIKDWKKKRGEEHE